MIMLAWFVERCSARELFTCQAGWHGVGGVCHRATVTYAIGTVSQVLLGCLPIGMCVGVCMLCGYSRYGACMVCGPVWYT